RLVRGDCESEIAKQGRPIGGEKHVGGLDVAMDYAERVGVLDAAAQLLTDTNGFRDVEAAAGTSFQNSIERAAGDVLADDEGAALVGLADIVDAHDIGMIAEPAHRPGFADDPRPPGVIEPLDPKQRDRDVAVEHLIVREIDDLARSLPQHPDDSVAAVGYRLGMGADWRIGSDCVGERSAANTAEFLTGAIGGRALGASEFERGSAMAAERAAVGVVGATLCAEHHARPRGPAGPLYFSGLGGV